MYRVNTGKPADTYPVSEILYQTFQRKNMLQQKPFRSKTFSFFSFFFENVKKDILSKQILQDVGFCNEKLSSEFKKCDGNVWRDLSCKFAL